jgi:ribosomal-protein-alanine N-acetyltransferase
MRAVNSWATKKAFIRRPGPDDIKQLLSIERQSFRAHRFTKEDFEYHLRNPSSIFAVSESSGKIVGYIAGIVYHGARHRVGKLYSMAVVSKFRKQGIGSLLLKYFEHEALKRKCVSVTLEVRSTNRSAQALYRRFGYEVEQVLPDYYGPGSVGLRMRKTFKHSGPRVR